MDMFVFVGAAAAFATGIGVGVALTLAIAKDKISAMTAAADEANAVVATQSADALKDLADAYANAEAMIGVIETAKSSTARAEASVTDLIARIHHARALIETVSHQEWFQPAFTRRSAASAPRRAVRIGGPAREDLPLLAAAAE